MSKESQGWGGPGKLQKDSFEESLARGIEYIEPIHGPASTFRKFPPESIEGEPVDGWIGRKGRKLGTRRSGKVLISPLERRWKPAIEG